MVFGQRTLRIRLRQVLLKDWIFFMVVTVVLQVSAPYIRTGFIIELKILILVFLGSSEDPHCLSNPHIRLCPSPLVNYAAKIGEAFHFL